MKKSQQEILQRIDERKEDADMFGAEIGDYVDFLEFEHAKNYLKDGVTKEQWDTLGKETDPVEAIKNYMSFAWEKANDCRGLSAARSLCHMKAWLWLDGQDEFLDDLNIDDYEHYGKEKLIAICEKYKIDWKQWDNGIRTNTDY